MNFNLGPHKNASELNTSNLASHSKMLILNALTVPSGMACWISICLGIWKTFRIVPPVGYGFTIMKDPIRPMAASHHWWVLILLKPAIKYGRITHYFISLIASICATIFAYMNMNHALMKLNHFYSWNSFGTNHPLCNSLQARTLFS